MSLIRKLIPAAALVSIALGATPAMADAITLSAADVGNSYTFNYDGFSGSTPISGLTASTTFTLTGTTANSYSFSYNVANTTGAPLTSRVSSFAFNTDPTISSANSTGAFSYTTLDSNYPNGIGNVDVCFKDAATGSCAGGGGGGLAQGTTGAGSFTLNFAAPLSSLTLSDFFVRYQSITGAGNVTSASGAGTQTSTGGTTTTSGGTTVPEPGMLGMMAGGIAALALLRRRRRPSKAALTPAFA